MGEKIKTKFTKDLAWNAVSFGGIVVFGVLLNIVILTYYDESALGVFNQVYALYILLSQLAVGGVHLSIQYYVPTLKSTQQEIPYFLSAAFASSLFTGAITVGLAYLAVPFIGKLLDSKEVQMGLYNSLWGLFFFSFNKIMLAVHNGMREMKKFAVFQFLRFFLMFSFLLLFLWLETPVYFLATLLAFSELVLFFVLLFSVYPLLKLKFNKKFKKIFFLQNRFGFRALLGNFLLDVNTKIDIFTLGIFLSDKWVGIYSFAATIAEGYMQFAVLLRNNINPIITKLHGKRNNLLTKKVLAQSKTKFFKVLSILGVLSCFAFVVLTYILNRDDKFTSILLYCILIGGFIISSGYQPFLMYFNQIGKPKTQTLFITFIFLSNVLFNFIFVPLTGVYGAAIGTALSFVFQFILFRWLLRKNMKFIF